MVLGYRENLQRTKAIHSDQPALIAQADLSGYLFTDGYPFTTASLIFSVTLYV